MTDHDRGAYAPQNDAPLAFDPRRAGARRGPPPVTLVVSIVVLCSLVIGGVLLYRHGARQPGQAPQVVGTPVGDFKAAPTSSQAASDSSASLQIYKTEVPPAGENTPAPSFTNGPEQPQPRPVARPAPPPPVATMPLRPAEPAPTVVAQNAAQTSARTPPATAKTAPPTPKVAPQPPPKVAPAKTVVAKLTPPTPPKTPPAKVPPPVATTTTATSGAAMVQIGALSSPELADKALSDVARQMGGAMAGKTRRVEPTSKDGKTFYRADLGGFADRAAAASFCASLKAKGGSCIVR
ncbi:MAG TPA: SPOR domain-containing protein [Caulobacteraceae bacterium]|nr:SPOR domain-containing protein [Caulobacteraceae bacterium]